MLPHDHLPPARPRVRRVPPAEPTLVTPAAAIAAQPPLPIPQPTVRTEPVPYEIGYRKPPVHSRYKAGASGNPKGRKKGSRNLDTLVLDLLDERIVVNTPTGRKTVARIEMLLRKLIEAGAKGNPRAIDQVLGRYALAQAASVPAGASLPMSGPVEDITDTDAASLALMRELILAQHRNSPVDSPEGEP